MKNFARAALGLAVICGAGIGTTAAHAQYPGVPPYYSPNPGYPPYYAPTAPGTTPPSLSGPAGWTYNPYGSNYAPNGSTGYAPYSQDQMNEVTHDGANSNGGGRR